MHTNNATNDLHFCFEIYFVSLRRWQWVGKKECLRFLPPCERFVLLSHSTSLGVGQNPSTN